MYWLTLQPSRWYRLDLNHWHASSLSQPLKTVASVDLRGFCGSRVSGPAAVTREVSMDTAVKLVLTQVLFTRAISNAVHIQSCWNLFHYWRRASGFSFYTFIRIERRFFKASAVLYVCMFWGERHKPVSHCHGCLHVICSLCCIQTLPFVLFAPQQISLTHNFFFSQSYPIGSLDLILPDKKLQFKRDFWY